MEPEFVAWLVVAAFGLVSGFLGGWGLAVSRRRSDRRRRKELVDDIEGMVGELKDPECAKDGCYRKSQMRCDRCEKRYCAGHMWRESGFLEGIGSRLLCIGCVESAGLWPWGEAGVEAESVA